MERIYYSIKEVSEMTDLPFSTLRYWETVFPQLSPKKNAGKTRFYTPDDIKVIERIKYLRDAQHLPIRSIANRLENDATGIDLRQRQTELLLKIREELVILRNLI